MPVSKVISDFWRAGARTCRTFRPGRSYPGMETPAATAARRGRCDPALLPSLAAPPQRAKPASGHCASATPAATAATVSTPSTRRRERPVTATEARSVNDHGCGGQRAREPRGAALLRAGPGATPKLNLRRQNPERPRGVPGKGARAAPETGGCRGEWRTRVSVLPVSSPQACRRIPYQSAPRGG